MFVVAVTFIIKPDAWEEFLPLMTINAHASVTNEAECQQFDVCTNPTAPFTVFLYEVYTDRAAFDVHLQTPHFKTFDGAVADMIAAKDIALLERIAP
jgi:quinol monooxygenase YgiN